MDVQFDSVAPRQAVTPIQPVADTTRRPGGEADQPTHETLRREARPPAVTNLNERVQNLHRELRFRVDETTGLTVVRVVEAETGDLIRQIASQNVLDMHALRAPERGLLLHERA